MTDQISTGIRKKSVKSLLEYFDEKHAKNTENGIFDFTNQYCKCNNGYDLMILGIYQDRLNSLLFDLENNKKTIKKIIKDINKKNIKNLDYNLAFYEPVELDEESWAQILLRRKKNEEVRKNLSTIEWKPCRDCKGNEYQYYQLQTRSADEPMTTFYVCSFCGWTARINR